MGTFIVLPVPSLFSLIPLS